MINEAGCGEFVPAGDPHSLATTLQAWADRPAAELNALGARGRQWVVENRTFERLADHYLDVIFPVAKEPS
jgi:glycosyltransferase involved in cell wall biosynthesis